MNLIRYYIFLIFLNTIISFSLAQTNQINQNEIIIDDPIGLAKSLISDQKYEQAIVLLETLLGFEGASKQFYFIETSMLLADVWVKTQNFDKSIRIYQNILTIDPGHSAARIELAAIFRLLGRHELALFHLELTDISQLPNQLQKSVMGYIGWYKGREGWSQNIKFAIAPDSNINSATENDAVYLYGMQFDLSDDAQKTSGTGLQLGGGTTYTKSVGKKNFIDLSLSGEFIFYPSNTAFNQGTGILRIGPRHEIDQNKNINLYLQSFIQRFGNRTYSKGIGLETSFRTKIGLQKALQVSFSGLKINNHFDESRNGKRYNIDTSFRYYFKGRGYSNFQLGLINASLESAALSSLDYYIGTGVYYQFSQGISASINSQYLRANYKKNWGAFGKKRLDDRVYLSVDFTKRDIQIFGFAPVLNFTAIKNFSNISLFEYTRFRSNFSFTKYF